MQGNARRVAIPSAPVTPLFKDEPCQSTAVARKLVVKKRTLFGSSISFGLNSKFPCSSKWIMPSLASFPERYGFAAGLERVFSSVSPNAMIVKQVWGHQMKEQLERIEV